MACKDLVRTCVRAVQRRPGISPDAVCVRTLRAAVLGLVSFVGVPWQTATAQRSESAAAIHFVLVSDLHYGLARTRFRGDSAVSAAKVNAALAAAVRALPGTRLPDDTGVHAGQPIDELGFVAVTGDIANRAEPGVQSAAASWQEFLDTFVAPLNAGRAAPLPMIVATGNHDASNAIGYVPALTPRIDTAAMAGLLRLIDPVQYAQRPPFDYTRDRIHYVRRLDGVALMVLHIWPDSAERAWMEQELSSIPDSVPVLLFAHDPPMVDISHFTAPGGGPPGTGGFQALLTEQWQGAPLPGARFEGSPTLEGFRALVRRHRNVRAYFHGHQNWTEFHALREADGTALLPAFRVDSPLKGRDSATDDTKLSFLVVTLDAARQRLTVREYRWDHVSAASRWGPQATILLR